MGTTHIRAENHKAPKCPPNTQTHTHTHLLTCYSKYCDFSFFSRLLFLTHGIVGQGREPLSTRSISALHIRNLNTFPNAGATFVIHMFTYMCECVCSGKVGLQLRESLLTLLSNCVCSLTFGIRANKWSESLEQVSKLNRHLSASHPLWWWAQCVCVWRLMWFCVFRGKGLRQGEGQIWIDDVCGAKHVAVLCQVL